MNSENKKLLIIDDNKEIHERLKNLLLVVMT